MPTASTALRRMSYYSYCVDGDLGEMFLNFPMDPDLRPYAGVDLRTVKRAIEAFGIKKGGGAHVNVRERCGALTYGVSSESIFGHSISLFGIGVCSGKSEKQIEPS
jgi:hypothetical protein